MRYSRMMDPEFVGGCRGFMGFFGPFGMILWTILIIAIIYGTYRLLKRDNSSSNHIFESLQMKYVSGEIDEEEYEKKIRILKKK